jgi:hypothetical protein
MKYWKVPEELYEEWGCDSENDVIDEELLQDFIDDGMPIEAINELQEI